VSKFGNGFFADPPLCAGVHGRRPFVMSRLSSAVSA
jgi:hypothetical protein